MDPGVRLPVTKRNAPDGDTCILIGIIPRGKGDPATGVSAPVPVAMEKIETLFDPAFPTYKKFPAESMARTIGAEPEGATLVRGVTSLRAPRLEIVNKEMSFSPVFAANKNLLDGWITMDCTAEPAVIGLPASCVSMPELGSSR